MYIFINPLTNIYCQVVKSTKKNIYQSKETRERARFGVMTLCYLGYSRRTSLIMGHLGRNGKHSAAALSRRVSSMFKELLGGQQGIEEKWARESIRNQVGVGNERCQMLEVKMSGLWKDFSFYSERNQKTQKAFKQKSNMSRYLS